MKELSEFFKVLGEAKKAQAEKQKTIEQVAERVKSDNPFKQKQIVETIKEESVKEEDTILTDKLDEILSAPVSPVAPNPASVLSPDKTLENKVKHLENWVSRIAATGPGSGEVNLRYLDDVNRSTINDNWLLEYDATSKKFQFTNEIGPLHSALFDITHDGSPVEPEGTLNWSVQDFTLNIHHKNGVVQQVGQETYYLVRNRTGVTIPNGTVCVFAGAETNGVSRLLVEPMIADGTHSSLEIVGVTTEDIVDSGTDGFVTSFGKVRGLDTTGGAENWVAGDILFVSPTVAGKMTKIKPTTPNNVLPIAVVLKVHPTDGEIFVRTIPEQRMLYARFSDSTNHTPLAPNTPYPITFNTVNVATGIVLGTPTSRIVAQDSGYFKFDANLSLTSSNSSAKAFYVWTRKNGIDIPNSAIRQSVTGNNTYQNLHYTTTISLNKNDYIEIMYATNDITISIDSPAATAFAPAIPSITLTVSQIAL